VKVIRTCFVSVKSFGLFEKFSEKFSLTKNKNFSFRKFLFKKNDQNISPALHATDHFILVLPQVYLHKSGEP